VPVIDHYFTHIEVWCVFRPDDDCIGLDIDLHDVRLDGKTQSAPLPQGVEKRALMFSHLLPLEIENRTGLGRKFLQQKVSDRNITHKTQPLTVWAEGIGQSDFFCYLPDFLFRHGSQREQRLAELELIESRKKIRLIFLTINPTK
jgi:hypothetical protein